jgi:hypothetical protein
MTVTFFGTTFVDEYTVADVRFAETRNQRAAEITRVVIEIAGEGIEPGDSVYVQVRMQGYTLGRNGKRDGRQATSQRVFGEMESEERYEFVRELALMSLGRHNIDRHKAYGVFLDTWATFESRRNSVE